MSSSRLSTFVIDCPTDDLAGAAGFWAQALRRGVLAPQASDERYRTLTAGPSEPLIMVQRVAHEGRIHLDIEADDLEAEVARLEQLGAKPIERVRTWVVMEAPTGQRFCVVRPQRPEVAPVFNGAGPEHAALARFAGYYRGTVRTWLDPSASPDIAEGALAVQPVFGGRWLRMEQASTVDGKPHAGEMLWGFHLDAASYEMCLVDSFHTGSSMMISKGPARADGVIAVLGHFAAGAESWGWRTELSWDALDEGNAMQLRAVLVKPDGTECPAIDGHWQRLR